MKHLHLARLLACLSLGAGTASWAQDAAPGSGEPDPLADLPPVRSRADFDALTPEQKRIYLSTLDPVRISLRPSVEYVTGSLSDIPGDLSVLRAGTTLRIETLLGAGTNFSVMLGQERSFYDFDGALGIVPADPADADPVSEGQRVWVRPTLDVIYENGWGWFATGGLEFAGEPGAVFDDSWIASGGGGVTYQVGDGLRLGLGVIAATRIEGGGTIVPFPVVEWAIADDWSLSIGRRGSGAVVSYQARDDLSFGLEVGFEQREYRLDTDNAFSGGTMVDRAVPVALTADWKARDGVRIVGRVGAHVWGEVEFSNAGGDRVNREERDPALLAGIEISIRF